MASGMLGQVLGSVLSGHGPDPRQAQPGAGGLGGLGGLAGLAGLGGGMRSPTGGGGRGGLAMVLLPLAMQWMQRSGGLNGVLQQMGQRGLGSQASSWVGTGENEPIDPGSVRQVMGREEVERLSRESGLPPEEVEGGMAEILPELVNHSTPEGHVPPDADDRLGQGLQALLGAFGGGTGSGGMSPR